MVHEGKKICSPKGKADVFSKHYANISKLNFSRKDRELNRLLKQRLSALKNPEGPAFTIGELKKAIRKMKGKGAAGPDDIPPSFLKNLGDGALDILLQIFNLSLSSGVCPQIWRNAIIIPLLKAGKQASQLESFRPISLTSCVVKLLERMIGERLYHFAESQGWFSSLQAGFRRGRSCEDQILKITQAIEDGFHNNRNGKGKHSVLVLLDFSKAYDTVWRQKLLLSMLDTGVPPIYIKWLYSFLRNRQARVRYDGTMGRSRQMHQGLPQGSVLAPILFVFYINNLAELLPEYNFNALFADDVSILASDTKKETAVAMAQSAVDIVVSWSEEWKLNLNAQKSEVSFFSLSRNKTETRFQPKITIDGKQLKYNPTPRLLGVYLDRELSFYKHVDVVVERVKSKLRMLAAVSNADWGWKKYDLKKIYTAHVRSIFDYAGCAWQPWLKQSHITRLERAQRRALRIITRQPKTSPTDCMRLEMDLPSIQSTIKSACMKAREKALRLPQDHPRRECLDQPANIRLERRANCRTSGIKMEEQLPAEASNRKQLLHYEVPPWKQDIGQTKIQPELPGITGKFDDPDKILNTALAQINSYRADYVIYTDGSAEGGMYEGGAAAVVTKGQSEEPERIDTVVKKGSFFTCSYGEEWLALELALNWIETKCDGPTVIVTDSQSLCLAILGIGYELEILRFRLRSVEYPLTIQWVPGHCGIPGNEMADVAAKEASKMEGEYAPTTLGSVCCRIRALNKDPPSSHRTTREVYSEIKKEREQQIETRSDQSLLARVRTGRTSLFLAVKNEIDRNEDPMCPLCRDAPHTLEHWMTQCAGTLAKRRELFGEDYNKLEALSKYPTEAVSLARSTLGEDGAGL